MDNSRIIIENVQPSIEGGTYPVKRVEHEPVLVSADIFSHGSEKIGARIRYKGRAERKWHYADMVHQGNDLWTASFEPAGMGLYEYQVEAWIDKFSLWLENITKWKNAGEDISRDIHDGLRLIRNYCNPSGGVAGRKLGTVITNLEKSGTDSFLDYINRRGVKSFIKKHWKKEFLIKTPKRYGILVDPEAASYSSWYELFPRSQASSRRKSGTFRDVERRIPDIREMGFSVLYLTPVHPVGHTNRRGKNGSMNPSRNDPGSPWAIGNENGGHKSVNPDLGTMDDFVHLVGAAKKNGMDVALDIALQCSPDHPYVREHPEWFYRRPDGTIRYAENPPKKYYDIYPLNFDTGDWRNLWEEMKSIFLFWAEKGVRIFRVDNPHTKPFSFWKWVISEVKSVYGDAIFLSEAFTRPKVMYQLSKLGFSQSYSYFTWKNYHYELIDYFTELNTAPVKEHFRPVLFTNTPDILTENLQLNGRPAFLYRAFLAATLSPSWGIYSGYELCENRAVPGTEEYLNSEKYEIRIRNWRSSGNIREYISRLNRVRKSLKPLQHYRNLRFVESDNPNVIAYERKGENESVFIAVNINPVEEHSATITLPQDSKEVAEDELNAFMEHMTGNKLTFYGRNILVNLKPGLMPGVILTRE